MILIHIKTNLRKFPEDCISCKLSYQDEWNSTRCSIYRRLCDLGGFKRADWCPLIEIKTAKEKKKEKE